MNTNIDEKTLEITKSGAKIFNTIGNKIDTNEDDSFTNESQKRKLILIKNGSDIDDNTRNNLSTEIL